MQDFKYTDKTRLQEVYKGVIGPEKNSWNGCTIYLNFMLMNYFWHCSAFTIDKTRVYKIVFPSVYPLYIKKAVAKRRTADKVDTIIFWLTGYSNQTLQNQIDNKNVL